MKINKNNQMINVSILILILLIDLHFTMNLTTNKKLNSIKTNSELTPDVGEYTNVYITNNVVGLCLTMNNNSQAYLATCNGSQNQIFDLKYDRINNNLSIINSKTGWSLEYFVSQNSIPLEPFKRSSYQYICGKLENLGSILPGDPLIFARRTDKQNQKFSFSGSGNGFQEFFSINIKNCFGFVSIDLENPNYPLGIYTTANFQNDYVKNWRIGYFKFSDELKQKYEQRPQILRNYETNECVTTNKKGEVYIRRCLGTDNQLWYNNLQGNQIYEIKNKENSFSLDLKDNKLVTSAYNDSNQDQKWIIEYSPNFSGYFLFYKEDTKKCVSLNKNNWNDDHFFLEDCDIFEKMQHFRFEIYQEKSRFYENTMPVNEFETRYLINKGTGLCVELVPNLKIYKHVECKDIPEQRFSVANNYRDELERRKLFYGFNNILIYLPVKSPVAIRAGWTKVETGDAYYDGYSRFYYSEVFPNTFQLSYHPNNMVCMTAKKEGSSYGLYTQPCDPSELYQHWQLVRVEDIGKDLQFIRPISSDPPSDTSDSENCSKIRLEGELRNAINDLIIPNSELEGLVLEFRDNNGNLLPSTVEGSKFSVNLKEGSYKVRIKTKNFSEFSDNISINNEKNQKRNFLLSPSSKGVRVVLTWNDKIMDLDLIANTSKNERINFSNKQSNDGTIKLDIDKRTGSGPETITVNENNQDDKITFSVHNYSNELNFSESEANVKVYVNDHLVENLNLSKSSYNPNARFWEVGVFDRSTNKFNKIDEFK